MTLEQVEQALKSLKDWPAKIGIIGGEPLLHPQFEEICELIQQRFPAEKMGLWTSGGPKWSQNEDLARRTFGFIAFNEHNAEQKAVCKHQPLTIAIEEAVPDLILRKELIDDCWVQRTWCATINHFGAYFCEVAAAQDVLLNEGTHAWPVTEDWWKKDPAQSQDQVDQFCGKCGMALPIERELIQKKTEKFTPGLLSLFNSRNLHKISNDDVEVVTRKFTREQIAANKGDWCPGNYRGDLHDDTTAPEGKGSTK